jgi:hypothetical protein
MWSEFVEGIAERGQVLGLDDSFVRKNALLVNALKKHGEDFILHSAIVDDESVDAS